MKEHFLVSVIISTCNRADYIIKAVESVLSQSYRNIELIVVDNGSVDKTPEVVAKLGEEDHRIRIIINKTNFFSRGGSSNIGIREARGKYIARLDDDDYWADPRKLEKQVKFLDEHPNYVLAGGGMIGINKEGKELFRCLFPENDEDIRKSILFDNFFSHGTVVFRKDAWEKANGYDEEIDLPEFPEDWDLYLKLGKLGKFYNFQEYFLYYLQAGQNTFRQNSRRNLKINNQVRKKYRRDYPGFWKAFLLNQASYFYSFFPFKKEFRPIFFKLGMKIFGPQSNRYVKK